MDRATLQEWFDSLTNEQIAAACDSESFDEYGNYMDDNFDQQVSEVAAVLVNAGPAFFSDLSVSRLADSFGTIEAYQVECSITDPTTGTPFYLGRFVDWKNMTTDRDATGVAAAWGIAEAIFYAYLSARNCRESLMGV